MISHQLQVINLASRLWECQLTEALLKESWLKKNDSYWISVLVSIGFNPVYSEHLS